MKEEILPIPNCPGYYLSNKGKWYSDKSSRINSNGKLVRLKPRVLNTGYLLIQMWVGKTRVKKLLSVMVATMFVKNPKPNKYNKVLHIDNNILNNQANNLKWGTLSMNQKQSIREGRRGNKVELTSPDNVKRIFKTQAEVSEFLKTSTTQINRSLKRGKYKSYTLKLI